jgi:transposase
MSDNPLIVGVDVHRKSHTVSLMDKQGREVRTHFKIDNNQPGARDFVQQVAQQVVAGDFDAIEIAAEATGWYWWHFFQTLDQDTTLQQWPLALYALNPRLTANFKKTYIDMDHCDPVDAFVAADRLRLGRDLPTPFHFDDVYFPLRCLTRYRRQIVQALVREKAYCLSLLYLKFSEYTHQHKQPFANIFGAASRAVIQEFASLEDIATMPFDDLVEFIDRKGKRRFADPADNARKLRTVAHDSYHLPQALQQPINLILSLSLRHIAFLEGQEKRANSAIAQALQPIPHTLDTLPGFGPVFCAGIISEIAGPERFNYDEAKVAKFAGFKWRRRQSADFEAEDTPISRNCNHHLRYYFCEAANAIRLRDPDYAAFYARKYKEVRKHQHKRAIVLTARKLVRLVVRLLTTNQPYRPRRC